MFAAIGSTITAAIASPCSAKIALAAPRSLKGAVSVSLAEPSVTPGEPGIPKVATPEPAPFASKPSECPW